MCWVVYVYIIIIYRGFGFVGGVLVCGCLCGFFGLWVLGFCFGLIVLIVITQLNRAGNLATVAAVVFQSLRAHTYVPLSFYYCLLILM